MNLIWFGISAEPLRCSSRHGGRQLIDIVLPVSVDEVFQLLFTASIFQRNFLAIRKTFGEYLKSVVININKYEA